MSALAFAILALLLTGPVPALLARARWPYRAPRAAMVLWQAIAVAAVLSAFSSGLAIASRLLVPGPDGHPTATITGEIDRLGWGLWLLYVTVFAITILIGVRLMVSVVRVGVRTRRRRARHRAIVDLLDHKRYCENWRGGYDINRRRDHDLRVLEVDEPLAYCLPGVRSRVVVSEGTLSTLGHNEVTAIVAHERAHLRARHDLVLEAFTAVHDAFPSSCAARARSTRSNYWSSCSPTTPPSAPPARLRWPARWSLVPAARRRSARWPQAGPPP